VIDLREIEAEVSMLSRGDRIRAVPLKLTLRNLFVEFRPTTGIGSPSYPALLPSLPWFVAKKIRFIRVAPFVTRVIVPSAFPRVRIPKPPASPRGCVPPDP